MQLKRTPLHDLHVAAGARMVEFASYEMPLWYPEGTIAEHAHTRTAAGLFDVSHMGVIEIHGQDRAVALERLVPSDIVGLHEERLRYSFLTNDTGGIIDDLVVRNRGDHLMLIANAGRKEDDLSHLSRSLEGDTAARSRPDLAILALQGPASDTVIGSFLPESIGLAFMAGASGVLAGAPIVVSRSGYTGEDGFEMVVPASGAEAVAESLLRRPQVRWAGLGARDTLRLEAGLCLYGHDLDETTTPVEAGLVWAMQKRRRQEGGFLGWDRIRAELDQGPSRVRVGIRPRGRTPVREGVELLGPECKRVGMVTSGGYGPTVGGPVAMGYVTPEMANPGQELAAEVRGREVECTVSELPFVPHRYRRGGG